MFEHIEMAPPDPILGLTDAFAKDTRPGKINLGVGVYKDEGGKTPIFASVKRAEERILRDETTKSYLPIPGAPEYGAAVRRMIFGADHPILAAKRAVTAHTPGGTGALRVAADFIKVNLKTNRIWVSAPTWENHRGVFLAAGLEVETYPYYDAGNKQLAFDAMMAALETVPEGEIVLFHACCHNPTGMDPDAEQWKAIAEVTARRRFMPFFDFAYQGLGDGLEEDAAGLRTVAASVDEFIVSSSFAKNFGLYKERAGAITLVAQSEAAAQCAFSQLKARIRTNYSNPPSHGGAIVTTVLDDPELHAMWEGEVKAMCARINGMRTLFVDTLKAKGVARDFSFITRQRGMFSFSGLTKEQVEVLRERYGIYVVASGRINVAAMTPSNMEPLCSAIAEILKD